MNDSKTGACAPVLFSVVVVTYNSAATIAPCLASVFAAYQSGVEVVVIDNASRDNTVMLIRQLQSLSPYPLTLLENAINRGFTVASNQGVRSSCGSTVVFLNPDTIVAPGWLQRLHYHLGDPAVAAVGPVSNFAAGRQSVGCHWQGALPQGIGPEQAADILFSINAGKAEETKLLIGFCLMVRRELLAQFGGLQERLFLGADDLELSWRLRLHGYHLLIATDCFVYHEGQHSFRSEPATRTGRLVQESTDALYTILEECYGIGRVPTPQELWDVDWFTPNNAACNPGVSMGQLLNLPRGSRLFDTFVSIVILTWNQLEYTKECLSALNRHTSGRYEVIIVDNGSNDGTVEWLTREALDNVHYHLVLNPENRGFAAGCNQGLQLAAGDWLVLLNNDVVVTSGWLDGLMDCHYSTPYAGIVGPLTNNASGIQGIGPAQYADAAGLERFAREFRTMHRHRRVFSRRLVGFCLLFPRHLYQKIGGLDERFGTGNYEDDDLCLRAAIAGYRNLVAADIYVHHHGSVSFQGGGVDYRVMLTGNWALFREKWSSPVDDLHYAQQITLCRTREEVESLLLQQRYDAAVQLLQKVCNNHSEDDLLRQLHAQALCSVGQFEEAARLGSTEAEVHCLLVNNKLEYIESLLRSGMFEEPGNGDFSFLLSRLMRRQGKSDYADALLAYSFMLSPVTVAEQLDTDTLYSDNLVHEAAHLYPDSKAIARLAVLVTDDAKQQVAAVENYLLRFGVDPDLLAKGLLARRIIGCHSAAIYSIPTVSLCMIVRDEAHHLASCLKSCRPLVSQMVVVDTGSADSTPQIAELFGAEIISHPWQNDYAAARNRGLESATGNWIMIMDADERLSVRDYQLFYQTLVQATSCAFSMTTRNYCNRQELDTFVRLDGSYPEDEAGIGWTPSDKVRLFPNHYGIKFEGVVHELVEGSVERTGLTIVKHPIPIHHYGGLEQERQERKKKMYYQLGVQKNELSPQGGDSKALYELAIQAGELEQYIEAKKLWEMFLQYEPEYAPAWFNLGYVCLRSGKITEATAATEQALLLQPDYQAARINRVLCRFLQEPIPGQITKLEQELGDLPSEPTLLIVRSLLHCFDGQIEKGVVDLRGLQQKKTNPRPFIQTVADLFRQLGKTDMAELLIALSAVLDS